MDKDNGPRQRGTRRCTVCQHRERAAIDFALARGMSCRAIGKRYDLGPDAVWRHSHNHLPPTLRAKLLAGPETDIDLDRLRETESQSLLANLVSLRHRLFATLDTAEEAGDGNMVSRLAGQLHRNLEITGKLLGDLGVESTTINNVLIMPQYVELRCELVRALAPYHEARQAVAAALHQIESKAAKAIEADARRPLFEATPIEAQAVQS
jgi:hypothetical protein